MLGCTEGSSVEDNPIWAGLTPNERQVVEARCLRLERHPTLSELAADMGISRERVRQLELSALHKLFRNARRLADYPLLVQQLRRLEEKVRDLESRLPLRPSSSEPPAVDAVSIDDLALSVRSFNALRNANIRTLGQLLEQSEVELLRIPNIWRKSLAEIKEMLLNYGVAHFGHSLHLRQRSADPPNTGTAPMLEQAAESHRRELWEAEAEVLKRALKLNRGRKL